MSSIVLLVVGLTAFLTGYRIYSKFIAEKIYRLDPDFVTPAHELNDGVDFVPTNQPNRPPARPRTTMMIDCT